MTPEQIELARHALGLDGRRTISYRNHFVVGNGHTGFQEWTIMATEGNAKQRGPLAQIGGDYMFHLTQAGAESALRPGESLDPEDFK